MGSHDSQASPSNPPSFAARRLVIARWQKGWTKKALADEVGITPQAIALFESGKSKPTVQTASVIAVALGFDRRFFYVQEIETAEMHAVSFRSRRSMPATVRDKTLSSGEIGAGIVSPYIRDRFSLPSLALRDLSGTEPEDAATSLRKEWQLGFGPIMNVVHLLEAKGVELYWFNERNEMVDAISFWWNGRPYALVSMRERPGERVRFDLAHELGHLVLHRWVNDLTAREVEIAANRFASAFLLPAAQFKSECPVYPTISELLLLKPRWRVSVSAMVYRSHDVGLLTQRQYERAYREISARWKSKKNEPNPLTREESLVHRQIFEMLASRGVYMEDFARGTALGRDIVNSLLPISEQYRRKPDDGLYGLTISELGYDAGMSDDSYQQGGQCNEQE